ncbi:hypothetical protein ACQPZJ_12915 [Actinoplanes sp. CA-054009]
MSTPITVPDALACLYLAQAAAGIRPRQSITPLEEIFGPLRKSGRTVAGVPSSGPGRDLRLAAAMALTVRTLRPGPACFHLGSGLIDHEVARGVLEAEFGALAPSRCGLDDVLRSDTDDACHVRVSRSADALGDLVFLVGSLETTSTKAQEADLREGTASDRASPDPLARQRSVPLIVDLLMGRRHLASRDRVVCELETTEETTDGQLVHAVEQLNRE